MVFRLLRVLLVCGLGVLGAPRVDALDRGPLFAPITVSPEARTWRDVQAVHHAWAQRMLLTPFRARALGKPWVREAMIFAEKAVDYLAPSPEQTSPPEALYRASQKLVEDGCRDPLIILLNSILYELHEDTDGDSSYLRDALAAARKFEGPKALAWLIARDIAASRITPKGEDFDTAKEWAADLGGVVVADGSYQPDEEPLFLVHLFRHEDAHFADIRARLMTMALSVKTEGWLKEMLLGRAEWAGVNTRTIIEEEDDYPAKKAALSRLEKARASFERAWKMRPDRPESAAMMVDVAFYRNPKGHEDRVWFDRAISVQFDYLPAYFKMLDHFFPGRGGSVEMMLGFGEACLTTGRYDTRVPEIYRAAVTQASHVVGDWRELYHSPEVSKHLLEVSKAVVDAPTRQQARKRNLDFFAVNAYLAGETELAASLRRESREPLCRAAENKLRSYNIYDFESMMKGSDADAATLQAKALQLQAAGSLAAAQRLFEEAVPKAAGHLGWVLQWQAGNIDFQRRLAEGDWVALPEDRTVRAWWGMPWALPKNRSGLSPNLPMYQVAHDYAPGERFEVRGQFPDGPAAKDGVVLSLFLAERPLAEQPGTFCQRQTFVRVAEDKNGGHRVKLDFSSPNSPDEEFAVEIRPGQNIFLFRQEGKKLSFEINGEEVFAGRERWEEMPTDNETIFGYEGAPVGVPPEKVEMRKLPQGKRPLREKA